MKAVTAIVLCGGCGRRLGGADKPLQAWRGRPLVAQVVQRLAPQVGTIIISANRNLPAYRQLAPVVVDVLPDYQGPLAGVAAALSQCETPLAMVCPGDAPLIPSDLVQRLADALEQAGDGPHGVCAAVARSGAQRHHLHCLLLRPQAEAHLQRHLTNGRRDAKGWLQAMGALDVDFTSRGDAFRNLNRKADFVDAASACR